MKPAIAFFFIITRLLYFRRGKKKGKIKAGQNFKNTSGNLLIKYPHQYKGKIPWQRF